MKTFPFCRKRFIIILVILSLLALAVFLRLLYLDTFNDSFLINQGDYESVHYRQIPAIRGMLLDRNGVPLAVSAPIYDIVGDPKTLLMFPDKIALLAQNPALGIGLPQLQKMLNARPNSRYIQLTQDLPPAQMQSIVDMRVPGIYAETHYQTYYPMGAPLAQVVGFTDNNNKGQDGLEMALEPIIGATQGREAVLRTAKGKVLGIQQIITPAKSGTDVTLSVDSRLQYIAYEALKQQVEFLNADNGSVAIVDPSNGQILAAVSYPSYNPNNPSERVGPNVKDRAITDIFEPGSTVKTFTIAGALEHGKYTPDTPVDTRPGWVVVGGHRMNDDHTHGLINVTEVLKYSSDVGITKIVFSQPREYTYNMITSAGFGTLTGAHFPGEARGILHPLKSLSALEFDNMAFGYHIAATTLQLARAYSAIANGGTLHPLTFIKSDTPPQGVRIMSEKTAEEMRQMLRTVVQAGGTGTRANIKAFTVAGKTGTSNIAKAGGYYQDRYNAMFVGMVPADHPRLVIAVHITNPQKGYIYHQGAMASAPVFATIANSAVRILGIPTTGSGS